MKGPGSIPTGGSILSLDANIGIIANFVEYVNNPNVKQHGQ